MSVSLTVPPSDLSGMTTHEPTRHVIIALQKDDLFHSNKELAKMSGIYESQVTLAMYELQEFGALEFNDNGHMRFIKQLRK